MTSFLSIPHYSPLGPGGGVVHFRGQGPSSEEIMNALADAERYASPRKEGAKEGRERTTAPAVARVPNPQG